MSHRVLLGVIGSLVLTCFGLTTEAQELTFLGGATRSLQTHDSTYAWMLEYSQGFGEHHALSFAYINEGHLPYHHRDGNAAQLWARKNLFGRRLSLAVGLGGYYYYDTVGRPGGESYVNHHGWGGIGSLSATWYLKNRLTFQVRANWIGTFSSYNTLSAVVGIGYQLSPPDRLGPRPRPPRQGEWTNRDEVVFHAGGTVVNSLHSELSNASGFEYRHGIGRYWDASVAWLNEGDSEVVRRNGLVAQIWSVRSFLSNHLALGVGGGTYFAVDTRRKPKPGESGQGSLDGIVSFRIAARWGQRWEVPLTWNRVVTGYNRDTDIFTLGLGYRF
jgi:hypothetical protein